MVARRSASGGQPTFHATQHGPGNEQVPVRIVCTAVLFGLAAACAPAPAAAHIALEVQTAPAASDYRAVFMVEHGCGNDPTTAIRVRLDDRIVSATPIAKDGWTAQVAQVTAYQTGNTRPPREVSWTGGRLPAFFPDQFTLLVKLPDAPPGTTLYFPVLQECGTTVVRWIELPLAGEKPEALDQPAPFVTLTNAIPVRSNAR